MVKCTVLLLIVLQALVWTQTQASLGSGFLKYKEYAAQMKEQIHKLATSTEGASQELKDAVKTQTNQMSASFKNLKEKTDNQPSEPSSQMLRAMMGIPPHMGGLQNPPSMEFKAAEQKQPKDSETPQEQQTESEDSNQEGTDSESSEDSATLEQDLEVLTNWISQTSGALLSTLSNKELLKDFIKNAVKESEFSLDFDTQLEEVKKSFNDIFNTGFETIHSTASETVKKSAASVLKSSLSNFDKASNDLFEGALGEVKEFFDTFNVDIGSTKQEENDIIVESENEVVTGQNSDEERVDVEVKIDIGIKVKGEGEEKQPEKAPSTEESLSDCLSELTKTGALQIEVKPGQMDDFSLSCKTPSCKKCLLWLYVASQKAPKAA